MPLTEHQRHHRRHQLKKQGQLCHMGQLPCANRATVRVTFLFKSGDPISTSQMCDYHYRRLGRATAPRYTVERLHSQPNTCLERS